MVLTQDKTYVLSLPDMKACFSTGKPGEPVLGNNTLYTESGSMIECDLPLAQWQNKTGLDQGTTVSAWPSDEALLQQARAVLER